ncbi:enoyl-CoA hydratase/isomerase family protein [Guggenheimella bovis]
MVHYEMQDNVAVISIDNPKTLNALNSTVLQEIDECLDKLDKDVTARVLLIEGLGKAFVAGADIKEMSTLSESEAFEFAKKGLDVFKRIQDLKLPTIALIGGYALGGGMELALACDIRYATAKAKFGQPEVGLGIIPGFGGTQRLARLVGPSVAKDLIFSGRIISCEDAYRLGIVNEIVEEGQLKEKALEYAKLIKKTSKNAVSLAKQAIDEGLGKIPFEIEQQKFAHCFAHPDQREGMSAFLEKRPATFKED